MKFRFITKAQDAKSSYTYKDQRGTEIYDLYDKSNEEPVPQIILDAEVIKEERNERRVRIKYLIYSRTFTLDGDIGYASWYAERGKKAFIRGGKYSHPVKEYSVEIVEMHPMKYVEACAELFNLHKDVSISVEDLVESREDYDVMSFDRVAGNIFPPVIDYKDKGQEGLHRALYAARKGINKIPVVVIR